MTATQTLSKRGMKPSSIVYWMRAGLAIAAGFANHYLGITELNFGELAFPLAVGMGIAFYLISILIVRNVLHFGEVELKGKNRYITSGGGTFIILWIMMAVLLNTIAK